MQTRRRAQRVGQLLAEEEPLDTSEQEDLIAGLADIQVWQS